MNAPDEHIDDLPVEGGEQIKGGVLAPEDLKDLRRDPVGYVTETVEDQTVR